MGITRLNCPYCGYYLGAKQGLSDHMYDVGPPEFKCPRCGKAFYTGGREWVDIPLGGRSWILFKRYIGMASFGAGVGVLVGTLLSLISQDMQVLGAAAGVLAGVLFIWWRHNSSMNDIRDSLKRQPVPSGRPSSERRQEGPGGQGLGG